MCPRVLRSCGYSMNHIRYQRTYLIVLATVTSIIILLVISLFQIHWTNTFVIDQATSRIRQHINLVWQILDDHRSQAAMIAGFLAESRELEQVSRDDPEAARQILERYQTRWSLDLVDVLEVSGTEVKGLTRAGESLARRFYTQGLEEPVSGYAGIPAGVIASEGGFFEKCCQVSGKIVDGIFIVGARPLQSSRGGPARIVLVLERLNNATDLVEAIQASLFKDTFYKGRPVGTFTIFAGPLRVSTSVLLDDGSRAVGTPVSAVVEDQVLKKGIAWTGRAKVLDSWYLSRYEPIRDPSGAIIGMLYVGELEQIYLDQKYESLLISTGAVLMVLVLAFLIATYIVRQTARLDLEKKKVRFDFIRVLGHELKAPLNAVEGYLDLMVSPTVGELPAEYREMVENSLVRLEYMRKLVSDLLDLTRIESGQKQRQLQQLDIGAVARESIDMLMPAASQRQIDIRLLTPEPVTMVADRTEIAMICNNLVSNAVKYNRDKGQIDVMVQRSDRTVTISVTDSGIGMSAEEVTRLFGEFVRIKNERTRGIHGTGLGLSIVKKIAALYRGEARVESEPNVGSTFTVILRE